MVELDICENNGVATLTLCRGKVNAINEALVDRLDVCLDELERDEKVRALMLTGGGKFFSFGFDIPELLGYEKPDFTRFVTKFTALYRRLFVFPKPVVAALNGHTMAGGCMLASACDRRLMSDGRAKIALNEISFGASVLAGAVEMLSYAVGGKNAETMLYGGEMFTATQAQSLGLVDDVCEGEVLLEEARAQATRLAAKDTVAFAGIKALLRDPVAARMASREPESIAAFVEIWYSPTTWEKLKQIKIAQ